MKRFLLLLFALILVAGSVSAFTVQDVVKLSRLKTSDELIFETVQRSGGLDRPLKTGDIIYMKEQGVSEPVIQYLIKVSDAKREKLPPQEGESEWITDNVRSYYTTNEKGKRIRVLTNLDENGKRIGGEVPYEPPPPRVVEERAPEPPREIIVRVEQQPQPEVYEEPPPPLSPYTYDSPAYYPSYPYYPVSPYPILPPGCCKHGKPINTEWRVNARDNFVKHRPPARQGAKIGGMAAGTRRP